MKRNRLRRALAGLLCLSVMIGTAAVSWAETATAVRLEDYAVRAMEQARAAVADGTFGVGGLLMDTEGNILREARSQVIQGVRINDPTAHVERQLVDWYLANREAENLPSPENCILITSLDPCVMCTGALAQAQFGKVIVIAPDDYAGINWQGTDDCPALTGTDCHDYVRTHFAYPAVTGESGRAAYGADLADVSLFTDVTISGETMTGCLEAFARTADEIRSKVSAASVPLSEVQNPAELAETHPIRRYLQEAFGADFLACTWTYGSSAAEFLQYLRDAHPGFDGVAYFDHFGNLLFLAEDDRTIPTQSAFMQVTRKLAAVRNTEPIEGYEINFYLTNPKDGYFVYMACPEVCAKTIMEVGAIGSTFENTSVHPILYLAGEENIGALNGLLAGLPPLYSQNIRIRFESIPQQ